MSIVYLNKDFINISYSLNSFFCLAQPKAIVHSHEFWELTYVYEGTGINCIDGNTQTVENGDFFLIKPGLEHSFGLPASGKIGDVKMLNCLLKKEYFADLLKKCCSTPSICEYKLLAMLMDNTPLCIQLSNDSAKNIKRTMWMIEYECNHFSDGSDLIINNLSFNLILSILRLYEHNMSEKPKDVSRNDEIERLIKYINSNFGQKLSLSYLANYIHLSREYLSRYFKQYTGKNISEYLLEIRMEHAKELLSESNYTIEDISLYCGYPTLSNFQRAFKSYVGFSPSNYRKFSTS